jgi:hypothetical protein
LWQNHGDTEQRVSPRRSLVTTEKRETGVAGRSTDQAIEDSPTSDTKADELGDQPSAGRGIEIVRVGEVHGDEPIRVSDRETPWGWEARQHR